MLLFGKSDFISVLIIVNRLRMSSKKIIRLNAKSKQKESLRTPQSTFANTRFIDIQSLIEAQNVECSQSLQLTLINQINKIYKEMQTIKQQLEKEQQINEELHKEKKKLKAQVRILEKEFENYKEMYEVQCSNHQRLRQFYQKREKEWQDIVLSHKRMLDQYEERFNAQLNPIQNPSQQSQLRVFSKEDIARKYQAEVNQYNQAIQQSPKRQIRRLKKINVSSRKQIAAPKVAYYYAQISRLYSQQKQFARKSNIRLQNEQNQVKWQLNRNPETDDLFERILRNTYYDFRRKQVSIGQIRQCQDMIKLKHAKTSTKQRLLKTIKKLDFQLNNDNELQAFCQHIEQLVLHQQKMLRGDLVYNFILQKLMECEKLAQSSNSQIERMEPSALKLQNSQIEGINTQQNLERVSRQNLQLLLNSTIKKPPPMMGSGISDKVRYSISSLQNLSDLIHMEMPTDMCIKIEQ